MKRFLTAALALLLTSLIAVWSTLAILGSATAMSQLIMAGGGYEAIAVQTRTAMLSSVNIPDQYRDTITQVFEKSLTAQQVEVIMQPLLVDVVGWLDQPAGTPAPQLVVNLSSLKTSLETELTQAQLSEVEKTALVAQVGKQIPDQLDIAQAQGLASQQGVEASTTAPSTQATAVLESFKFWYGVLQIFALIGSGVLLSLIALLLFISRKDGRAMLRRPAWIFISAGLFTTSIWLVSHVLQPGQLQQPLVIALSVAREITNIIVWYSLASVLFGAGLYGLSYLIKKPVASIGASPIATPPTTSIAPMQPKVNTAEQTGTAASEPTTNTKS